MTRDLYYTERREEDTDLEEELLAGDVVDEAGVVLVHHGQAAPVGAEVEAANRRVLLQQLHRERVVDEDLEDLHQTTRTYIGCARTQVNICAYLSVYTHDMYRQYS